jgi:hypothetical protein
VKLVKTMDFTYQEEMASSFTDVPLGSEYYEAVSIVTYYECMSGTPSGTFMPDETVTRA